MTLLRVADLSVDLMTPSGPFPLLEDVSFEVDRGESVGLVGESGSGKTMTLLAILRLLPGAARVRRGSVLLDRTDLLELTEKGMRKRRGADLGMVFQEPGGALDPVFTIGYQIVEAIRAHESVSKRAARDRAVQLLRRVELPKPRARLRAYPHQLSGGQKQRATIALALASRPAVLLADEPTSALDASLRWRILDLLDELREELGLAMVLVSHDLGLVARRCRRLVVFYSGRVVERGPSRGLLEGPLHPYTAGLIRSSLRLGRPAPRGEAASIPGQPPSPENRPAGCAFHPRCDEVLDQCHSDEPRESPRPGGGVVVCHLFPRNQPPCC